MKLVKNVQWLIAALLVFNCATPAFSQTLKEFFAKKSEVPLFYLGIDFSKTKLLDHGNPEAIRGGLYDGMNQVVVNEQSKYDVKSAFKRKDFDYDLGAVKKSNATANADDILSTNSSDFKRFKESDVTDIVKKLDISGKTGIGLVFVVEALRKVEKKGDAAIWVTLIDMKSKKILMTERVESKVKGGIGFKNFWVSGIRGLLDDIEDDKYEEWQKKYSN